MYTMSTISIFKGNQYFLNRFLMRKRKISQIRFVVSVVDRLGRWENGHLFDRTI